MAAEIWVNNNGIAHKLQQVWVNDAGTARDIREIWVNDAGTARLLFAGGVIAIPVTTVDSVSSFPTIAQAQLQFLNDGRVFSSNGSNTQVYRGDWITPRANFQNFEIRATLISGTAPTGTYNAFQALTTSRVWTLSGDTFGLTSVVRFDIRSAVTGVILETSDVTFYAETVQ